MAIESEAQRPGFLVDIGLDQTPGGRRLRARGAEFHQPLVRRYLHKRELFQSRPQPFQLPAPHRPLLGYAIGAMSIDVELFLLLEQLDVDALARLAPRLVDEMLF